MTVKGTTLTAREAARRLGVSGQTVLNWIDRGDFAGARFVDGVWMIPEREVEQIRIDRSRKIDDTAAVEAGVQFLLAYSLRTRRKALAQLMAAFREALRQYERYEKDNDDLAPVPVGPIGAVERALETWHASVLSDGTALDLMIALKTRGATALAQEVLGNRREPSGGAGGDS